MSKFKMKMKTKPKKRDMDLDAFIKNEEAKLGIKNSGAPKIGALGKKGKKTKNVTKPSFMTKSKNKTPLQEAEPFNRPPENIVKVNQNKIPVVK